MVLDKPVFVSRPTVIPERFEKAYSGFHSFLIDDGFSPSRLGRESYSKKAPLKAVIDLISTCYGAIVLGYPQIQIQHEVVRSVDVESSFRYVFPTPWNQIEGALAYGARSPVLVLAHRGVKGGVFDHGVTGEAVIDIDLQAPGWFMKPQFQQPYEEWKKEVQKFISRKAGRRKTFSV